MFNNDLARCDFSLNRTPASDIKDFMDKKEQLVLATGKNFCLIRGGWISNFDGFTIGFTANNNQSVSTIFISNVLVVYSKYREGNNVSYRQLGNLDNEIV